MKYRILYHFTGFLLFLALSVPVLAQKEAKKQEKSKNSFYHTLELGGIFGGQLRNEVLVLATGVSAQYTANFQISKRVFYGFGAGYDQLETARFLPLFADFKGIIKSKKNANFLSMKMGYALGWDQNTQNYINYKFRGGLFFNPSLGRRFEVNEKMIFLMSIGFKHQFARLQYDTFENTTYDENINYELVYFKVGVMLR